MYAVTPHVKWYGPDPTGASFLTGKLLVFSDDSNESLLQSPENSQQSTGKIQKISDCNIASVSGVFGVFL